MVFLIILLIYIFVMFEDQQPEIAEEFATQNHIQPIATTTIHRKHPNKYHTDKRQPRNNNSRCKYNETSNVEDKQCTFKPKINKYKSRNQGEFLELQQNFLEKKEERIAKRKQELSEQQSQQLTCKPVIDSNSKKIASKFDQPVFFRLSKQKQHQNSIQSTQNLFHPQILNKSKSLSRNDNVSELLYSDAQRRIEKQRITARESAKKREVVPKINSNTDKLVVRSLRQQFDDFTKNSSVVSPIVSLTILSQLFNLDLNPKKDTNTQVICEKILKVLGNSGISKNRLWVFIQAILGRYSDDQFSKQQQLEINKTFGYFYRTRLTKTPKSSEQQQLSFTPEILKNSQRLAAKKRQKMLTEANNMLNQQNIRLTVDDTRQIALADLYILERMHKQQQYQNERTERQNKQLQNCTFKPQINTQVRHKSRQSLKDKTQYGIRDSLSNLKSSSLFKVKTVQNKQNTLGTLNTQYSCQKQRHSAKHSTSKQKKIHEIKDVQKTMLRLSVARKNRQFSNLVKQRGYPKGIENWEDYRVSQKKAVENVHRQLKGYNKPRRNKKGFVFDVHVGNGVIETIQLVHGSSISRVVDQVSTKHGFDQCKKKKLIQMMGYHLKQHQNTNKQNQS